MSADGIDHSVAQMLAAIKDLARMLDAVRLSAGLGTSQIDRLDKAKALIERAERERQP